MSFQKEAITFRNIFDELYRSLISNIHIKTIRNLKHKKYAHSQSSLEHTSLLKRPSQDKTMQESFSVIDTKTFIKQKVFILPFWMRIFILIKMRCVTLS